MARRPVAHCMGSCVVVTDTETQVTVSVFLLVVQRTNKYKDKLFSYLNFETIVGNIRECGFHAAFPQGIVPILGQIQTNKRVISAIVPCTALRAET